MSSTAPKKRPPRIEPATVQASPCGLGAESATPARATQLPERLRRGSAGPPRPFRPGPGACRRQETRHPRADGKGVAGGPGQKGSGEKREGEGPVEREEALSERPGRKKEQQQSRAHPRFEQEEAETSKSHEGRILMAESSGQFSVIRGEAAPERGRTDVRGERPHLFRDPVDVAEQAVVAVGDLDESRSCAKCARLSPSASRRPPRPRMARSRPAPHEDHHGHSGRIPVGIHGGHLFEEAAMDGALAPAMMEDGDRAFRRQLLRPPAAKAQGRRDQDERRVQAILPTARATIAPSELPTTTAGRCFLTSQNATEVIALKSSLSNDGMFRSGARTRGRRGSSLSRSADLPPLRRRSKPWRYSTFFRFGASSHGPIKTRSRRLVNSGRLQMYR